MSFRASSQVHTTDVDEASQILSRVYIPAELNLVGKARLSMHINAVQLPALTAGYVDFGADVVTRAADVSSYYINVPLSGSAVNRWSDGHVETTTVGSAAVFSPGTPAAITWSGDCRQLCIKVARREMQHQLEALLNRPVTDPVKFARRLDLSSSASRNWLGLVRVLANEVGRHDGILSHRLAVENMQQLLIQSLLLTQPHNYADALAVGEPTASSKVVKHAVDLMHAHPEKTWDTAGLACATGVSARTLQQAFKRAGLPPPLTYLRRLRLHRVRAELTRESVGTVTVAGVAGRWGFLHMGRFAEQYRQLFGESPSETLRAPSENSLRLS